MVERQSALTNQDAFPRHVEGLTNKRGKQVSLTYERGKEASIMAVCVSMICHDHKIAAERRGVPHREERGATQRGLPCQGGSRKGRGGASGHRNINDVAHAQLVPELAVLVMRSSLQVMPKVKEPFLRGAPVGEVQIALMRTPTYIHEGGRGRHQRRERQRVRGANKKG